MSETATSQEMQRPWWIVKTSDHSGLTMIAPFWNIRHLRNLWSGFWRKLPLAGLVVRTLQRIAHRFNVHYLRPMPVIEHYKQQVICDWCGVRYVHNTAPSIFERTL